MRVRYTQRALDDLKRIYAHIFRRSPPGAANVRMAIRRSAASLAHARRGQATDRADVFRLPVVSYRYAIYFRVRADDVEIAHIRHTSRQEPADDEL